MKYPFKEITKLIHVFFPQQLYQTLTDYDIRFYMYEILKVRPQHPNTVTCQ